MMQQMTESASQAKPQNNKLGIFVFSLVNAVQDKLTASLPVRSSEVIQDDKQNTIEFYLDILCLDNRGFSESDCVRVFSVVWDELVPSVGFMDGEIIASSRHGVLTDKGLINAFKFGFLVKFRDLAAVTNRMSN